MAEPWDSLSLVERRGHQAVDQDRQPNTPRHNADCQVRAFRRGQRGSQPVVAVLDSITSILTRVPLAHTYGCLLGPSRFASPLAYPLHCHPPTSPEPLPLASMSMSNPLGPLGFVHFIHGVSTPRQRACQGPHVHRCLDGADERPERDYGELLGMKPTSELRDSVYQRSIASNTPTELNDETGEEERLVDRIDELERRIQLEQLDVQPVKTLFDRAQRQPSSFDRRQILDWETELRRHQKQARRTFEALWKAEDKLDKLKARQRYKVRQQEDARQGSRCQSQRPSRNDLRRDYQHRRQSPQITVEEDYPATEMSAQNFEDDENELQMHALPRRAGSTRRAAPRCARSSISDTTQRRGSQQTDHDPSVQAFEDMFDAIRQQHLSGFNSTPSPAFTPIFESPAFYNTAWNPHYLNAETARHSFNPSPFSFALPSQNFANTYGRDFPLGPGAYHHRTFGEPAAPPGYVPMTAPQPPPYNALLAEEARRLYLTYDDSWNALQPGDPNIPFPARALKAEGLDDRSSIWAFELPPTDNWSRDDIAKANVQTFFLGVVDLTPAYPEVAGRVTMSFDEAEASYRQVRQLVDLLKKEKIRWHSDRLGRRNGDRPGVNEALQNDFHARTVFYTVCELMQIAQTWLEMNLRLSSDAT